jgi:hypothetical protein
LAGGPLGGQIYRSNDFIGRPQALGPPGVVDIMRSLTARLRALTYAATPFLAMLLLVVDGKRW